MPRLVTGLTIAVGCHILLLMVPIHSRQETHLQLPKPGGITVGFGRITPAPPEKPEEPEKPEKQDKPKKESRVIPPPPGPILPLQERIEKPKPKPKPKRKPTPPRKPKKKRTPIVSHPPTSVKTETQQVPKPMPSPPEPNRLPTKIPSVIGKETHRSPAPRDMKAQVVAKNKPSPVTRAYPANDGNPPPKYPTLARRRGWEGTVLLSVWVSKNGRVDKISIAKSCGYSLLDKTALKAVARYRFIPGRKGDHPVAMRVQVPVDFRLNDTK